MRKSQARNLVQAALLAAVTAVLSQIQLSIGPVPFNLAVLGAYLKRGANLMFLAQQHRYVPSAELRYALEESISSLELAGVECAMEVTQGVRLPAEAAAACYSRFESVVEGALGQLDALFVRAIWKDHRLNLYLSVETGADLKAACPAAVQEAPGSWVLNDHFEGGAPECGTN